MIRKAIIPAAGLGTRMLPATKAIPKELLTIVNKPVIQYVVEEAIESGITEILIVISRNKTALQDHFAKSFPNEDFYEQKGKTEVLNALKGISGDCEIEYIEQHELNGLGDAIHHGKEFAGTEPFAVLLGDTICESDTALPILAQLIDCYNRFGSSVTAIEQVPLENVSRYGIMGGEQVGKGIFQVNEWVEKPQPEVAPSQLAIASRYVFTAPIFDALEKIGRGVNNELQLTDAMKLLLNTEAMYGLQIAGRRFDVGNPQDFIKTNIHFGLKHHEFGEEFRRWLEEVIKE
ncbi:MAG: UTP--glucose-1-phosphate uridylyltransferase GalU [Cytophagia bacterium]|nr:UTP--glucose-1-phosphate uridylyltransferase GalU [Cytophagia bacterium]